MTETILSSLAAFAGTNIDDIFINTLFFSEADTLQKKRSVIFGKYLGTGLLFLIGFLGASGLRCFPAQYTALLGLIPVGLGIKEILCYLQRNNSKETEQTIRKTEHMAWNVMFVTIASGADNIGVYIPLFTNYTSRQMLIAACVFAVMTALWCLLGKKFADLPLLQKFLTKHKHRVVPAAYIAIGIYIMLK